MKCRRQLSVGELRAKGVVGLTKAQMAGALQISVRFLSGMMERREIAYWRVGKRLFRFRLDDAVRRMNETVLVPARDGRGPADAGNPNPEIRNPRRHD